MHYKNVFPRNKFHYGSAFFIQSESSDSASNTYPLPWVSCSMILLWSCCICLPVVPLCTMRKIRHHLTQYATQLLIQATVISHIDYCNFPVAGPSFNHSQTHTAGPKCSGASGLRSVHKGTCHFTAHQPPLATHGRPNQIQVTSACLQGDHCVCAHLLELEHLLELNHGTFGIPAHRVITVPKVLVSWRPMDGGLDPPSKGSRLGFDPAFCCMCSPLSLPLSLYQLSFQ